MLICWNEKLDFPALIEESVEEALIKAIEPFLKDGSRVKKLTFYSWLHTAPS